MSSEFSSIASIGALDAVLAGDPDCRGDYRKSTWGNYVWEILDMHH